MTDVTCSVEGCTKPPRPRCVTGPCEMHYCRMRKTGTYDPPPGWKPTHRRGICTIEGCRKRESYQYLCAMHYARLRRHGDPRVRLQVGAPAGPDHPSRKPIVRYESLHQRIGRERGRAAEHQCIDCGAQAAQWSYDHSDPDELLSDGGLPYSLDLDHYAPRCHLCHMQFDGVIDAASAARRRR